MPGSESRKSRSLAVPGQPLLVLGGRGGARSLEERVRLAAAAGYAALALDVGDESATRSSLDALRQSGLRAFAVASLPRSIHLPDRPEAARVWLGRAIRRAAQAGADVLGGALAGAPGELDREPARARSMAVEVLHDAAAEARAVGVRLALLALNRYESSWLRTPIDALALVEEIDSPAVGLMVNTFSLRLEGFTPAEAQKATGAHLLAIAVAGRGASRPASAARINKGFAGALLWEPEPEPAADALVRTSGTRDDDEPFAARGLAVLRAMAGLPVPSPEAAVGAYQESPPPTPGRRRVARTPSARPKPASKSYRR